MTRKAIQGYTEKSYYENTRYTGVVATTDPLNEGYFKHLVNFDISDTGQSITPRKGYLTTTLRKNTSTQDLITLSKNTIVFKDNQSQNHIVYDFINNKGYIADISAYNLNNKLLPVTNIITNIDWETVLDYLIANVDEVATEFAALRDTLAEPPKWHLEETTSSTYTEAQTTGQVWQIDRSSQMENATAGDVEVWFLNQEPYATLEEAMLDVGQDTLAVIRVDDGLGITYWLFVRSKVTETEARSMLLTYILANLQVYLNSKIEHIVDIYGIFKTLVKVGYIYKDQPASSPEPVVYPFLLEIYYRKDATTISGVEYPADTLVLNVVDTDTHPTYDPTQRNIASSKSIIPPVLQTVHTATDRPAGHYNVLGNFLYVKDTGGNYVINYIYRNINYLLTPYFDLDPAFMALNNVLNTTDSWAYRFDIISTAGNTGDKPRNQDIILRGAWMQYKGPTAAPTPVFPDIRVDEYHKASSTADMELRHYRNCRYVIYILTPDTLESTISDYQTDPPTPNSTILNTVLTKQNAWEVALNKINSISTLRSAIEEVAATGAYFHIYYLGDMPASVNDAGDNIGTLETNAITDVYWNNISRTSSDTVYKKRFMTGDEVLAYITEHNIFSSDANGDSIAFRLLPYASQDTYTDADAVVSYRFLFRCLSGWNGDDTTNPRAIPVYNWYSGNSQYGFYRYEDGKYIVGTSIAELKGQALLPDLENDKFLDNGIQLIFYIRPYEQNDITSKAETNTAGDAFRAYKDYEIMKASWATTTPYKTASQSLLYGYDALTVTTINQYLTKEPTDIQEAKNYFVYNDTYLVVWNKNVLYISEPGTYYYFKETSKKEFTERIVKVIQFKTVLLVFTIQNLYAVYIAEVPTTVDGPDGPTQSTIQLWAKQTVLYNIRTSDRYIDVIQVFNQMILFYSEDGQLFMIKPSTMIDSETQFSLQYFNKSVNDILINYDKYINERLANYNIDQRVTKDQIKVKALLSVNFIKIFYYVPGFITYILIYDVINNRYTVYDTLTFTEVTDKLFIESGELYLTTQNDKLYFTFPYTEPNQQDNIVDMSITNNFKKIAISSLVDTGNLNLNNHLTKRFRDLHITFKNLSASKLLFNAETVLDDVVSHPYYDTQIQVQDIGGVSYYVSAPKTNENDLIELVDINHVSEVASSAFLYALNNNLFEEHNMLLDFADYTSSKLLTHRTSILGMGKVFRLKLQFISKGNYKIQTFGIIYKERRI